MKKTEHVTDPTDIEINSFQLAVIMGDAYQHLDRLISFVFCDCGAEDRKLVSYNIYLNELDDIVLQGECSACGSLAARYLETGENPESRKSAEQIRRAMKK